MAVITAPELVSYLRLGGEPPAGMDLIVELANGTVEAVWTGNPADPTPARVRAIAFEVAARAWRNPEGKSSEAIDDYRYTLPTDTRGAGVYLTPGERAELLALVGGAFTSGSVQVLMPQDIP